MSQCESGSSPGHGSIYGEGRANGGLFNGKPSDATRLILELNMIKKAAEQNLLPLIPADSLEFEESKYRLEQLLKED